MSQSQSPTPLMQQYFLLKEQSGDALLFFRMGDFYELFGDDAITASQILEITLTSRDKSSENPMPMAGVPHHSAQSYIQKLLQSGKKVAIAEQMEDPSLVKSKNIVKREIVRIFSPAIQFEWMENGASFSNGATSSEENYLGHFQKSGSFYSLVLMECATGTVRYAQQLNESELIQDLQNIPIKHLLFPAGIASLELNKATEAKSGCIVEWIRPEFCTLKDAKKTVFIQYRKELPLEDSTLLALGILIKTVEQSQKLDRISHLKEPEALHSLQALTLGLRTSQHLDLLPTSQSLEDGTPDLFSFFNKTKTRMGARLLKRWIAEPLIDPKSIAERQGSVQEFQKKSISSIQIQEGLKNIYDLERILGRITTRLANPRDTFALGESLSHAERISAQLQNFSSIQIQKIRNELDQNLKLLHPLTEQILRTQKSDAPLLSREGGIFLPGTDPELDRLLSLSDNGQRWLIDLETQERANTQIPSLKVRYNRVYGYYIEITKTHLKSVPSHYQRKQSTTNGERFFTEELKKFEDDFLNASQKQRLLEQDLFEALLDKISSQSDALLSVASKLAEIDTLVSFSCWSQEPGWVFPKIDQSLTLQIQKGRHPIVESALKGKFVPNSVQLSPETRLTLLITGPNMGGKSTVMRQVALIIILGQIGAPVPAQSAHWGIVHSIHTRIGAQDAIARGQSTFMVEMTELAQILKNGNERSLILLDEIGRGTSTYDGISVAWATLEWICNQTGARTLFATHYHELTELSKTLPRLANTHMAVSQESRSGASLRFLYELRDGPSNDSFGIQVAEKAGLPDPVIRRAWQVLEKLEAPKAEALSESTQLSLFESVAYSSVSTSVSPAASQAIQTPENVLALKLVSIIENVDINSMTPLQALTFLAELKEESQGSQA